MRALFAAIVVLGLPAYAAAQSTSSPATVSPPPSIGLPLPVITSPLAPIGLPLGSIGLPLAPLTPGFEMPGMEPPRQPAGDRDRRRGRRTQPTIVYVVPSYGWNMYPEAPAPAPPAAQESSSRVPYTPEPARDLRATGILRLELEPVDRVMQLYVDGYFVGTPDDYDRELRLEAGAHTIELRAPEYETLTFDVRILADRAITYRGGLQRLNAVAPDPAAPAPSTTFYFIPGCYMGNIPPEKVTLPANCDLSRLITHKP